MKNVKNKKLFYFLTLLFLLVSCKTKVETVEITPSSVTIDVKETIGVKVKVSPSKFENNVVWSCSDSSIVYLSDHQTVRGLRPGQCVLSASVDDVVAYCTVDVVIPEVDFSISPSEITIYRTSSEQLTACFYPVNVTNQDVFWESSDSSIVSIDQNGVIKGLEIGNVTITGYTSTKGEKAFCQVKVISEYEMLDKIFIYNNLKYRITSVDSLLAEVYLNRNYTANGLTIPQQAIGHHIPFTVIGICDSAFCNNTYLSGTVSMPNTVRYIGNCAFRECNNMENIALSNVVENIGFQAFYSCKKLSGTIDIPETVKSIGRFCFAHCKSLSGIKLNNQITKIESYTFYHCSNLQGTLTITDNITSIGLHAFNGCASLERLVFNSSIITDIGDYAFYNCNKIGGTVSIPNSVTAIGCSAFRSCSLINTLNLSQNLTEIGSSAFYDCSSVSNRIILSEKLTEIADYTFYNCKKMSVVSLPRNVSKIGQYAFWGCSSISSIEMLNTLTTIDDFAFAYCSGLDGTLKIPNKVNYLGDNAFCFCIQIDSVALPSLITSIGDNCFFGCSDLNGINLNSGLTHIGSLAFSNCTHLYGLYFYGTQLPSCGTTPFRNTHELTTLYVISNTGGLDIDRSYWQGIRVVCLNNRNISYFSKR